MFQGRELGGAELGVGTVYCIGRNYAAHARELGNAVPGDPVVFLKAAGALRGLEPAPVAFASETFHHEVEVVIRVGRSVGLGQRAGWSDVSHVALGLDLTRREVQTRLKTEGLPWTAAKSFAGSGVLGPFVPLSAVGDPESLAFGLEVNGEARQRGEIGRMTFSVPTLLSHLATLAPLVPGDLVYTGTPEGVGPLRVGDTFSMDLTAAGGQWSFSGRL
ncbi:MAG: fumarylacetoacetate hydrolase family protein [Myxococcota bacterium]